jgi:hypothetical protein
MMAGLGNRTRERHSSTVQLVADSRRHGTPTRHAGSMPGGVRSGGARRASRWYADPGLAGGNPCETSTPAVAAMSRDAGRLVSTLSSRRRLLASDAQGRYRRSRCVIIVCAVACGCIRRVAVELGKQSVAE